METEGELTELWADSWAGLPPSNNPSAPSPPGVSVPPLQR